MKKSSPLLQTLQATLPSLGIFLSLDMSRSKLEGSRFVGLRCTNLNENCLRTFTFLSSLLKHKRHPSQRSTPCANTKKAVDVYEINDNRPGSLQPSRIETFPLSGTLTSRYTHRNTKLNRYTHRNTEPSRPGLPQGPGRRARARRADGPGGPGRERPDR